MNYSRMFYGSSLKFFVFCLFSATDVIARLLVEMRANYVMKMSSLGWQTTFAFHSFSSPYIVVSHSSY